MLLKDIVTALRVLVETGYSSQVYWPHRSNSGKVASKLPVQPSGWWRRSVSRDTGTTRSTVLGQRVITKLAHGTSHPPTR
jgi:hypothetical protein